jgi:hypothetical protein
MIPKKKEKHDAFLSKQKLYNSRVLQVMNATVVSLSNTKATHKMST